MYYIYKKIYNVSALVCRKLLTLLKWYLLHLFHFSTFQCLCFYSIPEIINYIQETRNFIQGNVGIHCLTKLSHWPVWSLDDRSPTWVTPVNDITSMNISARSISYRFYLQWWSVKNEESLIVKNCMHTSFYIVKLKHQTRGTRKQQKTTMGRLNSTTQEMQAWDKTVWKQ